MGVRGKNHQRELMRMTIAALVAALSVAALALLDFGPNNSRGNADGMITSAVLACAGAIATPSERPVIAAPETIRAFESPGKRQ
jgi:hypothetical protein